MARFGLWLLGKVIGIAKLIRSFVAWLFERPVRALVAVLLVLLLVQQMALRDRARERDEAQAALSIEEAAHDATVENYDIAAREAGRLQEERNLRAAKQQAEINERVAHDYEDRIAAVRARADQLRIQLEARAGGSGASAVLLPGTGHAASRATEAAPDYRFPPAGDALGVALMTLQERTIATEQAIQLSALIDWIEAQGAVQFNTPAKDLP